MLKKLQNARKRSKMFKMFSRSHRAARPLPQPPPQPRRPRLRLHAAAAAIETTARQCQLQLQLGRGQRIGWTCLGLTVHVRVWLDGAPLWTHLRPLVGGPDQLTDQDESARFTRRHSPMCTPSPRVSTDPSRPRSAVSDSRRRAMVPVTGVMAAVSSSRWVRPTLRNSLSASSRACRHLSA